MNKWRKSGSVAGFLERVTEELRDRALDNTVLRRVVGKFTPKAENQSHVFLVGCYNSGTTLLQKIMLAHPEIAGPPREGVRYAAGLSNLETNGHHMMWGEDWRDIAEPSAQDTAQLLTSVHADWRHFRDPAALYFLDKSIANTGRIDWLSKNFTDTRFIGIHRNGYCVCESLYRRARPPQWLKDQTGQTTYPLEQIASLWHQINTEMLQEFSDRENVMVVKFEDLIEKPELTIQKIFAFLNLETTMVKSTADGVSVNGISFEIRDPNPASLARLGEVNSEIVKPVLSAMLKKLGYQN